MMNYYDALLQHRNQVADAERHHEQARHLRDSKRARQEQAEAETTDQPSSVARIVTDLKAVLTSLRPASKPQTRATLAKDAR